MNDKELFEEDKVDILERIEHAEKIWLLGIVCEMYEIVEVEIKKETARDIVEGCFRKGLIPHTSLYLGGKEKNMQINMDREGDLAI